MKLKYNFATFLFICPSIKVDIIISEPMGYMLLNERMLETFLHAKKFLKPNGKMFPTRGDLHVAPFTDEALYMEQYNKVRVFKASNEMQVGQLISSYTPEKDLTFAFFFNLPGLQKPGRNRFSDKIC